MRLLLLLCPLSLTGCLTTAPHEPVIVTQTVEVPVPVKCAITYPTAPSQSVVTVPKDAKKYDKAKATLQELEAQRWYAKELHAALTKCAKDQEKD